MQHMYTIWSLHTLFPIYYLSFFPMTTGGGQAAVVAWRATWCCCCQGRSQTISLHTHTHTLSKWPYRYILELPIQFNSSSPYIDFLLISTQLHEYGLTMAELGFDPAARSLNKTKRLLALTGASDTGPGPARYSETAWLFAWIHHCASDRLDGGPGSLSIDLVATPLYPINMLSITPIALCESVLCGRGKQLSDVKIWGQFSETHGGSSYAIIVSWDTVSLWKCRVLADCLCHLL